MPSYFVTWTETEIRGTRIEAESIEALTAELAGRLENGDLYGEWLDSGEGERDFQAVDDDTGFAAELGHPRDWTQPSQGNERNLLPEQL